LSRVRAAHQERSGVRPAACLHSSCHPSALPSPGHRHARTPAPARAPDPLLCGLGPIQLPRNHRRLASDRALVGRMVILARLEPIEHFTHELPLRLRKPIDEDSASDRYEERVPVISGWRARPRCTPATWLTRLLPGCCAADGAMLSLEPLDFQARDQDVGRRNHNPVAWFADPLPFGLNPESAHGECEPSPIWLPQA
jgi:hypothetical protein